MEITLGGLYWNDVVCLLWTLFMILTKSLVVPVSWQTSSIWRPFRHGDVYGHPQEHGEHILKPYWDPIAGPTIFFSYRFTSIDCLSDLFLKEAVMICLLQIYTGCYDGSVRAVKLNLIQNYRCWVRNWAHDICDWKLFLMPVNICRMTLYSGTVVP